MLTVTPSPAKTSTPSGSQLPQVNAALKIHDAVEDSKPTVTIAAKPKGKRKQSLEKTLSHPKKRKMSGPLLAGPLDPNVHVADRLQFNLNAEEKKPFKEMTPSELLNMAYELIARASICMNYFVGTTKPLLVSELETAQQDLEKAQKENTTLTTRIEEI